MFLISKQSYLNMEEVFMVITRRKPADEKNAANFIAGAPDARPVAGIAKGKKRQISLTITPKLLRDLDALARKTGQTRAGLINMAVFQLLERGIG
jgi:hypothetical protein